MTSSDHGDPIDNEIEVGNSHKNVSLDSSNKKFVVQLTFSQSQAINQLLPRCYTLLVQREVKTKRTSKKKNVDYKKEISSILGDPEEPSPRVNKSLSHRYNEEFIEVNNYSKASSQGLYADLQEFLKPCMKILNLLKTHKHSWPFKEPVDHVALGIPNYLEIIK